MRKVVAFVVLTLVNFVNANGPTVAERASALGVTVHELVEASKAALAALSQTSESGIYETLVLESIDSVDRVVGRFHDSLQVRCKLSSSAVADWHHETEFVIMREKGTKVLSSVAIESLPSFPPHLVEEYMSKTVEKARLQREQVFFELEQEFLDSEKQLLERMNEAQTNVKEELAVLPAFVLDRLRKASVGNLQLLESIDAEIQLRLEHLDRFEMGQAL